MKNTNFMASIVKVLENPSQMISKDNMPVTKFRVQFPQFRNTQIVNLTVLGHLALDVAKHYQVNDYILIEGYLSLNRNKKNLKKVEITILKMYPFLLGPNR